MKPRLKPVLSLVDPGSGIREMVRCFGFAQEGSLVALGDQEIRVVGENERPAGFIDMPFDHLAIRAPGVNKILSEIVNRGGQLHAGFTPQGLREIPEFGPLGARFVFFKGPEGWPLEYCELIGQTESLGHGHFGIRTNDFDKTLANMHRQGARTLARHSLVGQVCVAFLDYLGGTIELFDEGPYRPSNGTGWVGFED